MILSHLRARSPVLSNSYHTQSREIRDISNGERVCPCGTHITSQEPQCPQHLETRMHLSVLPQCHQRPALELQVDAGSVVLFPNLPPAGWSPVQCAGRSWNAEHAFPTLTLIFRNCIKSVLLQIALFFWLQLDVKRKTNGVLKCS